MATRRDFHFFDERTLIDRLTKGLRKGHQEVVFLVGAPLSAPHCAGAAGVPGVEGIIDLIRLEFVDDAEESAAFDRAIASAGERRYQAAFVFLQGRRGQYSANQVVRAAVQSARLPNAIEPTQEASDDSCRLLEADGSGWALVS